MIENGADKVQAINLNDDADHGGCVTPAVTATLFHFLGYRDLTKITGVEEEAIELMTITTNNGYLKVDNLPSLKNFYLTIISYDGRTHLNTPITSGQEVSVQLRSGMYIGLISEGSTLITAQKLVIIE